MKRRLLPIPLMALVVVLALAAMGVGYGLWSKNLVINGTVHTGDLDADWDAASTNDPGTTPDPGSEPAEHVGSCEVDVAGIGTQELNVTIDNAYPSYQCTITGVITNTGDIPFNITGYNVDIASPLELVGCDVPLVRVDPGQEESISCTVHVQQEAEQNADYAFTIKTCVAQWNEPATYEQCVTSPEHEGP